MASALQRLFKKRRANASAKGKAPVAHSPSSSSSSSQGFPSFHSQHHLHHPVGASSIGSASVDTQHQQPTPALTVSSLNSSDGRPSSALYAHSTFASSTALDEQLGRLSLHGDGGVAADALGRRRARAQSVDALGGYTWAGIGTAASHRSSNDWADQGDVASPINFGLDLASAAQVDDVDDSPIFVHLSQSPTLAKEWDETRLVLVPSPVWVESLTDELLQDDAYVVLHAFAPSRMFQDRYVGVRAAASDRSVSPMGSTSVDGQSLPPTSPPSLISLSVTVDAAAGTVHVSTSVLGRPVSDRTLAVVGEMSFYRTMPARSRTFSSHSKPASPTSATFEAASRSQAREKVRVRCLCVEGLVVPQEAIGLAAAGPEAVRQATSDSGPSSHSLAPPSDRRGSVSSSSSRGHSTHSIAFPTTAPAPAPSSHASFHVQSEATVGDSMTDDATMVDATQGPARRTSSDDAGVKDAIPSQCSCFVDLALILHPPEPLRSLGPALEAAFSAIRQASAELTSSYVLVKGFEMYNVGRVRRGVIAKAWLAFENARAAQEASSALRLDTDARTRLLLLLENVAMAHCHSKLFRGVLDASPEADGELDETLEAYAMARVGMLELDIRVPAFRHRPERLRKAISRLEKLRDAEQDLDSLLYPLDVEGIVARASEVRVEWDRDGGSSGAVAWPSLAGATAGLTPSTSTTTPLDTLETLRATIEEVGKAADHWQMTSSSRLSLQSIESSQPAPMPLGADELLPVLAYVVVKARPRCFVSLLAYARTFGLSNVTSPEINWALTTFEAVVDYLRRDPLCLGPRRDKGTLSRTTSMSSASSHGRSLSPPPAQARALGPATTWRPALVSTASHHGGTQLLSSSTSSLRRARRVSLPATSGYATSEPAGASLLSSSITSTATPRSERRRSSIISDEGGSTTDASPTLSQDGFKVPALPSGGASLSAAVTPHSRRASRSSALSRPRSILGSLDEGHADAHSPVMQRTGSGGGVLPSPEQQQLHIRPQIVVRTRKNTSSSVSTLDQAQALARSGAASPTAASLSSSPPVRVVGRPQMLASSSSSAPMGKTHSDQGTAPSAFYRRTSMDSWGALSLLGGGVGSRANEGSSSRPTSPGVAGPSSWLGSSWVTASTQAQQKRSSSTSRPASITSVEGFPASSSSTYNTLPRSRSGSGFADATTSEGSHRASNSATLPMSSSTGSLAEVAAAAAAAAAATSPAPSTTTSLSGRRKRTRLLSESSPAAPQLTPASELAPASFSKAPPSEVHLLGEALQAVVTAHSSGANSGATSPSSTSAGGPASALGLGLLHPHHAASDGYFPPVPSGFSANLSHAPALRVVVPSPVEEIADPMSAAATARASPESATRG